MLLSHHLVRLRLGHSHDLLGLRLGDGRLAGQLRDLGVLIGLFLYNVWGPSPLLLSQSCSFDMHAGHRSLDLRE